MERRPPLPTIEVERGAALIDFPLRQLGRTACRPEAGRDKDQKIAGHRVRIASAVGREDRFRVCPEKLFQSRQQIALVHIERLVRSNDDEFGMDTADDQRHVGRTRRRVGSPDLVRHGATVESRGSAGGVLQEGRGWKCQDLAGVGLRQAQPGEDLFRGVGGDIARSQRQQSPALHDRLVE